MTIDHSILQLEAEGTINIPIIVRKMRSQRPLSVGMPCQYAFCHRALIEYALNRKLLNCDINLEELDDNEKFDKVHMVKVRDFIKKATIFMQKNQ